ncbi:MAG: ABC transporter permease [Candidatus Bipolaricaulis sp.]|nr:ABC transporter permease [Candidatus Bipolaricaulis sp.]
MTNRRTRMPSVFKSKMVILGLVCLIVPVVFAATAQFIAPHDPNAIHLKDRLTPPAWSRAGTSTYLLGTDSLGRDVLSRMMYGAQISLLVGVTVVLCGGALGILVGVLSGYFGGAVDSLFMRLADVFLAFPFLLLALAIMAILGPGLWKLIIALAITSWVPYARVARAKILAIKQREFVQAARAIGGSSWHIMVRHMLPNTLSSLIVLASFRVASAIAGEAALSFLGLGVGPNTPSWGSMLSEGRVYLTMCWWLATLPGLLIVLSVLGSNLIGDGTRDVLDPKFRHVRGGG